MIDKKHECISGYDEYMVTEDGDVYSIKRKKYLKNSYNQHGHVKVELWHNNKRKVKYVHRLIAETYIDNPCKYKIVNHIDNNPSNNSISNLEWTTNSGNIRHAISILGNFNANKGPRRRCINGHEYTLENTEIMRRHNRNDYQSCIICRKCRESKYKHKCSADI